MTRLVRDFMHPGVIACRPDATLGQVAVMLAQHHVHALIVADRDGVRVRDHSRFGTWLNGAPVAGEAPLEAGDRLRLGTPGVVLELVAVG